MSDVELSAVTKALLKSAKLDAPGALAKSKIWVDVVTGGNVGGVGAASGASVPPGGAGGTGLAGAASGTSAKLLAAGALLGSAVTVGLAMAILRIVPVSTPPVRAASQDSLRPVAQQVVAQATATVPAGAAAADREGQADRETFTRRTSFSSADRADRAEGASAVPPKGPPGHERRGKQGQPQGPGGPGPLGVKEGTAGQGVHAVPSTEEETLMREASLVAEARGALRRGDPAGALRAIQAARQLPIRQLVPEEMSLEAQALRASGKAEEADRVNGTLKAVFPDHALAR